MIVAVVMVMMMVALNLATTYEVVVVLTIPPVANDAFLHPPALALAIMVFVPPREREIQPNVVPSDRKSVV